MMQGRQNEPDVASPFYSQDLEVQTTCRHGSPTKDKSLVAFECGGVLWGIDDLSKDCGGCFRARNLRLKTSDNHWLGIASLGEGRLSFRFGSWSTPALQFSLPLGLEVDPTLRLGGRVRTRGDGWREVMLWFEAEEFLESHGGSETLLLSKKFLTGQQFKGIWSKDLTPTARDLIERNFGFVTRSASLAFSVSDISPPKVRGPIPAPDPEIAGIEDPVLLLGYRATMDRGNKGPSWLEDDPFLERPDLLQLPRVREFDVPAGPTANTVAWRPIREPHGRSRHVVEIWNSRVVAPLVQGIKLSGGHSALSVAPTIRTNPKAPQAWNAVWRKSPNRVWQNAGIQPFQQGTPRQGLRLESVSFPDLLELQSTADIPLWLGADAFGEFRGSPGYEAVTSWRDRILFSISSSLGGDAVPSDLCSWFAGRPTDPSNPVPLFAANARLRLSGAVPAGQDTVADERLIDEGEVRSHVEGNTLPPPLGPIVIPLRLTRPASGTTLKGTFARVGSIDLVFHPAALSAGEDAIVARIVESNVVPSRYRTVHINLKQAKVASTDPKVAPDRLLVLDSEPFSVAIVELPETFGLLSSTVESTGFAQWSNQGENAGAWQIPASLTGFDLILPPQVIGEEMVKAKEFTEGQLVDYRFAPPAKQRLTSLKAKQTFAEAPWNMRRLLGYAGQPGSGANVIRMGYELLYGLSCSTDFPFLRLSEIGAVIGRPPGALVPRLNRDDAAVGARMKDWDRVRRLLRGRLAVYEPWDWRTATLGEREALELSESVSCRLRGTADLFYPARPSPDTPKTTFPTEPEGLKGGVTWGFEVASLYNATVKNPQAVQSSLMAPLWSTLGGWGSTKATFDEGRQKVSGRTEMGWTSTYVLERVGRVGVFWNRAKHVIVYQRTTSPSAQFKPEQFPNLGRALLRKTDEYIEILEDERRPIHDKHQNSVASGALKGVKFQSRKIPVLSRWGKDIIESKKDGTFEVRGWAVPLWNPAAPTDIYPRPQVTMILAAEDPPPLGEGVDSGEKGGEILREVKNPNNLWFYTEVKEGTGADSEKWDLVPGLDGPTQRLAKEQSVGFGEADPVLAPFTLRLLPGQSINVTSARQSSATKANFENVSPFRGIGPQIAADDKVFAPDAHYSDEGVQKWVEDSVDSVAGAARAACDGVKTAIRGWEDELDKRAIELKDAVRATAKEKTSDLKAAVHAALSSIRRQIEEPFLDAAAADPLGTPSKYLAWVHEQIASALAALTSVIGDAVGVREQLQKVRLALAASPPGPWAPFARLVASYLAAAVAPLLHAKVLGDITVAVVKDAQTVLANQYGLAQGVIASLKSIPTLAASEIEAKFGSAEAAFFQRIGEIVNSGAFDAFDQLVNSHVAAIKTLPQPIRDACGLVSTGIDETAAALKSKLKDEWEAARDHVREVLHSHLPTNFDEKAEAVLALGRAFGAPPTVPQIKFEKDVIAYAFDPEAREVAISQVATSMKSLDTWSQETQKNLGTLGINIDVNSIGERLLPSLPKVAPELGKILPDFAGLDLNTFLKGTLPTNKLLDNVRLSHGLDPKTRQAWARADVDVRIEGETPTLFTRGPVLAQVERARLEAQTTMQVGLNGATERSTWARISGDWVVQVASQKVLTFRETALTLDESGRLNFNISPDRVVLAEALKFLTELLASISQSAGLPPIEFVDGGIQVRLDLPVPDTQGLTSGFSGLNLACLFGLSVEAKGLGISVGLAVGRKDKPFNIAIFVLGGGGYIELRTKYLIPIGSAGGSPSLTLFLDVSITASASLALSLGPISGGVAVYLGITAQANETTHGLQMGILVIVRGDVSIASFINASVVLSLAGRYENNRLHARGSFSFSVKISWFFTFEVHSEMDWDLGQIGTASNAFVAPIRVASAALSEEWLARALTASPMRQAASPHEVAAAYVGLFARD